MPKNRIGKFPGPFLTDLSYEDNARTGATSMVHWEGSYSEIQRQQNYLRQFGPSNIIEKPKGDGNWIVEATFPFGFDGRVTDYSFIPSLHELDSTPAQISIYQSEKVRRMVGDVNIGIVARAVQQYEAGQYSNTTGTGGTTAESRAESDVNTKTGNNPWALLLFKTVAYRKTDSFIEFHQTYRRTLTCATPNQARASFRGAGMIWTSREIMVFEGLVRSWFQLPWNFQWLKSLPVVQASSGGKTQITYNYTQCKLASGLVYDAFGSAQLLYA